MYCKLNIEFSLEQVRGDMAWLFVEITSGNGRELSQKLFNLKQEDHQQRVRVFPTNRDEKDKYDVLVPKNVAERLLSKGIPDCRNLKFSIHKRNFE